MILNRPGTHGGSVLTICHKTQSVPKIRQQIHICSVMYGVPRAKVDCFPAFGTGLGKDRALNAEPQIDRGLPPLHNACAFASGGG